MLQVRGRQAPPSSHAETLGVRLSEAKTSIKLTYGMYSNIFSFKVVILFEIVWLDVGNRGTLGRQYMLGSARDPLLVWSDDDAVVAVLNLLMMAVWRQSDIVL